MDSLEHAYLHDVGKGRLIGKSSFVGFSCAIKKAPGRE